MAMLGSPRDPYASDPSAMQPGGLVYGQQYVNPYPPYVDPMPQYPTQPSVYPPFQNSPPPMEYSGPMDYSGMPGGYPVYVPAPSMPTPDPRTVAAQAATGHGLNVQSNQAFSQHSYPQEADMRGPDSRRIPSTAPTNVGGGSSLALKNFLIFLHVAIYMVVGILGYRYGEDHEGWTFTDGFYFTMMTMSTVGYGDISPSNDGMRVFTLVMIFWGIMFVFPSIAAFISPFSGPLQQRFQDWLEELFPPTKVDMDGDGTHDYAIPVSAGTYYFKNLFPSIFLNIVIQLISAGIFVAIEDTWSYFDAFYHCMVTATTVGYGDQTILTQDGRLWASVHMAISVVLLGEMISRVGDAHTRRAAELRRVKQLQKRLNANLLENLMDRAQEIRPAMHRDGRGLTELEFVLCMVLELELVALEDLQPFIKQFRALDASGDGRLNAEDLDLQRLHPKAKIDHYRKLAAKRGPAMNPQGV